MIALITALVAMISYAISADAIHTASPHLTHVLRDRYLETLEGSLTGHLLQTPAVPFNSDLTHLLPFDEVLRRKGEDWPLYGLTMTGIVRLKKLRTLLEIVFVEKIPGCMVECGVWRGGSSIYAKAVLLSHNESRDVHLFDSFSGLPRATSGQDNDSWSRMEFLRVSLEEVSNNFRRYNLLDNSVYFHKGFFRYTLPPVRDALKSVAILRLDGDMYESTMDELYNLYNVLSIGGFIIIDDWTIAPCQKAVTEFRIAHNITDPIVAIDSVAAYWRKSTNVVVDYAWYLSFNKTRSME